MDGELVDGELLVLGAVVTATSPGRGAPQPGWALLRHRVPGGVTGRASLWLLAAGIVAAAVALWVTVGAGLPVRAAPVGLPWWALAIGFCLAEVAVVNYDFRREAHSFSMNELPLVLGLFLAAPQDVVLGTVAGTGATLLLQRRQHGLKLVFNLGHFGLGAVIAVVLFHAVAGEGGFTPRSWAAVLLAVLVTSSVSTGAIFVAISVSEGRRQLGRLAEQVVLALLTTAGSASLGLLGVGVAWQHPAAGWLLVVPVGAFFLAYRGYVLKRQERDSLEFLYRSVRALVEAPDLETGMGRMLSSACATFRAETAQFAMLGNRDGELSLLVTATADSAEVSRGLRLDSIDGLLQRALQSPRAQVLAIDPPVATPGGPALRQVMIAPVRPGVEPLGALLVGNRLGAAGSFGAVDLKLLETLVSQIGVALENGRLAQTLTETAHRAERERQNALVLQRGILPPPLPRVPGVDVAVRYRPGTAGMEVGGDWYDVIPLPGGDVGIAIGDVVGHDLEAAARMGQARSALRAYATEGHGPAAVMSRLNRLLAQTDAEFLGTCCYLQLSPSRGTVTVVDAGHPPPLLVDPSGRGQALDLDPHLPLGVDQGTAFRETVLELPRGATLALFTDGLVESRSVPLEEGLARLLDVPAATARGDLETLAERFITLARAGECEGEDDLTLVLLRYEGAAAAPSAAPSHRREAVPVPAARAGSCDG